MTRPTAISGREASARSFANIDQERLENAVDEPSQWMTHGGTYEEQRFSNLDQIDPANVSQLGLAWYADLNTNRGQESTPLMIDGVLYVTESWSRVSAYDARTGQRLWHYDPEVPGQKGSYGCCDVVNRGVAAWQGKIYVGAYDGRLIALDAETGEVTWSVVTVDQSKYYTITGAPRVANGKVFMGNAGAEYITRGYVSAYDAETGELLWRFFTVPGDPALGFENDAMRMAAETWSGEWWKLGGGGSTWDALTYDPQTNLLLFGVGNGSPWNAAFRSPDGGDNLFTVSIVAVDADTGEYAWHFQEIPAEEWDYDAAAQITLADIEIDGAMRRVAMQATKSGYFYMLDVRTGELLRADNFVPVNWTSGYDMTTGKPVINQAARYTNSDGFRIAQPGAVGAHSWHPVAYNPDNGLLYIPASENSIAYAAADQVQVGNFSLGVNYIGGDEAYEDPENTIERFGPTSVIAWDPVRGREVWKVERDSFGGVGTLATAGGLVFTGDPGAQEFMALDAATGEKLWSYDIKASLSAGAISYALDGIQYVTQVVGGVSFGGGYYAPTHPRLLVFRLGGDAELPPNAPFTRRPFDPPELTASDAAVERGASLYGEACAICHGGGGANRGMFPDLRRTPLLHSADAFDSVVLGGSLADRGMAAFANQLDTDATRAIRAYLTSQAIAAAEALPPAAPGQN